MTRQDIIDMIAKVYGVVWTNEAQLKDLERFAALVIANNPPQRTWVSLTDEEVGELSDFAYANDEEFVRQVEKHLKEKNNG
jgi:ligand-binding SRPBCC domain-containing protein